MVKYSYKEDKGGVYEKWKNVKWIILVLVVILIPLVIFKSCQRLAKSQNEQKNKKD